MEWDRSLNGNGWNTWHLSDILRNRLRFRNYTAIPLLYLCRIHILLLNNRRLLPLPTMRLPTSKGAFPIPQVLTPTCRNILVIVRPSENNASTLNQIILEEAALPSHGLQMRTTIMRLDDP